MKKDIERRLLKDNKITKIIETLKKGVTVMKKIISIILTVVFTLALCVPAVFAADGAQGSAVASAQTEFSDISSKNCEKAVIALVKAGIINGFSDGTFRPDANITRAQACTLISKAFPELKVSEPANTIFVDVDTESWYADAVAYCAHNRIVQGDGNAVFRPAANVSNYEIIAMLVRAMGLADDANMAWPGDYVAVAEGKDLLKEVSLDLSDDGNKPASRGDVSIMLCAAAGIEPAEDTKPEEPSKPSQPSYDADFFSGKSGNAYGFILSSGHALNDKGDDVGMIEFFMQGNTYTLLERSSSVGAIDGFGPESGLVRVTLSNGQIKEIHAVSEYANDLSADLSDKSSYPFTITQTSGDTLKFYKVTDAGNTYAYYDACGEVPADTDKGTYVGINNPCVVYTCKADGSDIEYEIGANGDINEGSYIAAFAVDKDSAGVADIVLVIDENDADELLDISGGIGTFK